MKEKLKDYIETVFADAPKTEEALAVKEEMLSNLYEKFDRLTSEGKSESAAFNTAIASVGDVSEVIQSLIENETVPETEFIGEDRGASQTAFTASDAAWSTEAPQAEKEPLKKRNALSVAIAVALFILSPVPVILFSELGWDTFGIALMFGMIAFGVFLLILFGMTKEEMKEEAASRHKDHAVRQRASKNPVYKAISSLLWALILCLYFGISFTTGKWQFTWLIFPIGAAVDNIIKAFFDLVS